MDEQLKELKRRVERTRKNAAGHREYDEELRAGIVEYVSRRQDEGATQAAVARELGITQRTIWGWMRRERRDVVRPVVLVEDVPVESTRGRTLVLPSGARIEGLTLGDVLELLRGRS
jgi:transposase-like protein